MRLVILRPIASIWGGSWPGSRANVSLPCRRALTHRSVKKWFKKKKKTAWNCSFCLQGLKKAREKVLAIWWSKVWAASIRSGQSGPPLPPTLLTAVQGRACDTIGVRAAAPRTHGPLLMGGRHTLHSTHALCPVHRCEPYRMNSNLFTYSLVSSGVVF